MEREPDGPRSCHTDSDTAALRPRAARAQGPRTRRHVPPPPRDSGTAAWHTARAALQPPAPSPRGRRTHITAAQSRPRATPHKVVTPAPRYRHRAVPRHGLGQAAHRRTDGPRGPPAPQPSLHMRSKSPTRRHGRIPHFHAASGTSPWQSSSLVRSRCRLCDRHTHCPTKKAPSLEQRTQT